MKVIYPIQELREDRENPFNLQSLGTIWEYYLLENLSCGLVRDSIENPISYEGCLAQSFFYDKETKDWIFQLRDIFWSNGVKVNKQEIDDWIESLIKEDRRHIRYLRLASGHTYDESKKELRIHFDMDTDDSILHELSLADSGLIYRVDDNASFHVSVGPYYINEWDYANKVMKLSANSFSPLFRQNMPKSIELFKTKSPQDFERLFNEIDVDLVSIGVPPNPKRVSAILNRANRIFSSINNAIFYLYFNHDSIQTHSIDFRRRISYIGSCVGAKLPRDKYAFVNFKSTNQMIPRGFNGYIPDYASSLTNVESLPAKVRIKVMPIFKNYPELIELLISCSKEFDVDIEVVWNESEVKEFDIGLDGFVGNQRDSSGSWAFLTDRSFGPLKGWRVNLEREIGEVFESNYIGDMRKAALDNLHIAVLSQSLLVPLFTTNISYLAGENVELNKFNSFDGRLRFYDIAWK